jgi:hypothetical protein
MGQQVHYPAEQDGIEKLQARDDQVRKGQNTRYAEVPPEQAKHPSIHS